MDFNNSLRQCPNGHWYDASAYRTCPQCGASAEAMEDYGPTEPVSASGRGDIGVTQPVRQTFSSAAMEDYDPTEPVGVSGFSADSPRPSAVEGRSGGSVPVEEYGATVPAQSHGSQPFSPVTGWLVCVEGPDRGRDYRVRAGYNRIGRSDHMDICITGDPQISRDRQAMIAYDPEEKQFFFGPDEGRSLVRLNGKLVMSPSALSAYDVITIGSTKLIFIPLCGERFSWDG